MPKRPLPSDSDSSDIELIRAPKVVFRSNPTKTQDAGTTSKDPLGGEYMIGVSTHFMLVMYSYSEMQAAMGFHNRCAQNGKPNWYGAQPNS